MRALAALHSMGYQWTTAAGADKAIRHWQAANRLEVDGIVGKQTLASLNLLAGSVAVGMKAPAPAVVRQVPQPVPAAAGDVESIIRDVWPAELADQAVAIATRESRLQPTAHNSCCIGLFSIYFAVHRAWLAGYGVNQPSDLYDPRVNATVAYALYQQAGWQPWAL
jgi:peptidoglycan hydrolase-like protein with peptidoglycan-binding domain